MGRKTKSTVTFRVEGHVTNIFFQGGPSPTQSIDLIASAKTGGGHTVRNFPIPENALPHLKPGTKVKIQVIAEL